MKDKLLSQMCISILNLKDILLMVWGSNGDGLELGDFKIKALMGNPPFDFSDQDPTLEENTPLVA